MILREFWQQDEMASHPFLLGRPGLGGALACWLLIPELPTSGYIVVQCCFIRLNDGFPINFARTLIFQITSSKLSGWVLSTLISTHGRTQVLNWSRCSCLRSSAEVSIEKSLDFNMPLLCVGCQTASKHITYQNIRVFLAWTYYIIQISLRTCIPFCRGFTWIVSELAFCLISLCRRHFRALQHQIFEPKASGEEGEVDSVPSTFFFRGWRLAEPISSTAIIFLGEMSVKLLEEKEVWFYHVLSIFKPIRFIKM